jgi:hypothetical protein
VLLSFAMFDSPEADSTKNAVDLLVGLVSR